MRDDGFSIKTSSLFIPPDLKGLYETTEDKIARLEIENKQLSEELADERAARYNAEKQAAEYLERITELTKPKEKRTATVSTGEYCDFKSDGKRKPHAADSIRSYEDLVAVQNYFLDKGKVRDYMLWTVGIAFGLRISDLLNLKIRNILNDDLTFREHITVIEQKTSKLNSCLITEAVVDAVTKYFDSIGWKFNLDDYLFSSRKTKGKMYEEYGWKIISDAGKALKLPINIGSHTMRKSFANIVACVDKSSIDMNVITKIQGLLNHSNQQTTLRYLGKFAEMYDRARVSVSDFIMGKTDIHELNAGSAFTIEDVVDKLDSLEAKLKDCKGVII